MTGGILGGCGTTKEASNTPSGTTETSNSNNDNTSEETKNEMIAMLASNRSQLKDVYISRKNDIPEIFLQKSNTRDIGDPNEGYRIQILSTRNVSEADSIANDFRFWADSAMTNNYYIPKAYVFFRQPYYKVHVGNFQFQDQALKLNRVLKSRYPDAWVVHDEIDPHLVPPDTTQFSSGKSHQ